MSSSTTTTTTKEQKKLLQDGIELILKNNFDVDSKMCIITLMKILDNILTKPGNDKVRSIRIQNPTFYKKVGQRKGGIEFLLACNFQQQQQQPNLLSSSNTIVGDNNNNNNDITLVLLDINEDTNLIITGRRMLLLCATHELHMKADSLPKYIPPTIITTFGSPTTISNIGTSSGGNNTFDVYKGQRYDAKSAATGIHLGPDNNYKSITEQKLTKLQQQKEKLQKQSQPKNKKLENLTIYDRQLQAFLPSTTTTSTSTNTSIINIMSSSSNKSDNALIASHISNTIQKSQQQQNQGFTTRAMRELSKIQKQKVYTHVQLMICFMDGSYLKGIWYPNEKVSTIQNIVLQSISLKDSNTTNNTTNLMTLHITPPKHILDPNKTLQEEGLVPAAKIFVSWLKPIHTFCNNIKPTTTTTKKNPNLPGCFIQSHLFQSPQQQQQLLQQFPQGQSIVDVEMTNVKEDDTTKKDTTANNQTQKKKKKTRQEKEADMLKRMMGGGGL